MAAAATTTPAATMAAAATAAAAATTGAAAVDTSFRVYSNVEGKTTEIDYPSTVKNYFVTPGQYDLFVKPKQLPDGSMPMVDDFCRKCKCNVPYKGTKKERDRLRMRHVYQAHEPRYACNQKMHKDRITECPISIHSATPKFFRGTHELQVHMLQCHDVTPPASPQKQPPSYAAATAAAAGSSSSSSPAARGASAASGYDGAIGQVLLAAPALQGLNETQAVHAVQFLIHAHPGAWMTVTSQLRTAWASQVPRTAAAAPAKAGSPSAGGGVGAKRSYTKRKSLAVTAAATTPSAAATTPSAAATTPATPAAAAAAVAVADSASSSSAATPGTEERVKRPYIKHKMMRKAAEQAAAVAAAEASNVAAPNAATDDAVRVKRKYTKRKAAAALLDAAAAAAAADDDEESSAATTTTTVQVPAAAKAKATTPVKRSSDGPQSTPKRQK